MDDYKTEQDFIWDSLDDLFPNTTSDIYPQDKFSIEKELKYQEAEMLRGALEAVRYNQTHAARRLGIGRTNLIARCKRLGIDLHPKVFHDTFYLQN